MANNNESLNYKTRNFLLPCTDCTKKCYRIHGKQKEKESFDPTAYFFKVMLGDFAHKLRIPPAFVGNIRKSGTIPGENVFLHDPAGQRWVVKLCGTSTELEFLQGWEKFVGDHTIELGDFVSFEYIRRSCFKVRIFGRSGCEKKISVSDSEETSIHLGETSPATVNANLNFPYRRILDSQFRRGLHSAKKENDQAGEKGKKAKQPRLKNYQAGEKGEKGKHYSCCLPQESLGNCQPALVGKEYQMVNYARTKTKGNSYQNSYYASNRRPFTEAERSKALNAANSFTSDAPFCLIIMKPSHVYKGFRLGITKSFANHLQLPRERTEMTLVDPNNKEWHIQYLGDCSSLSGGWKIFSLNNNLEEGDICIFEMVDNNINNLKLRVHIFRVVQECTPFTKMVPRQMNNSIALPTNQSNKKMKVSREDLAPNLSGQASGTEEGQDAKQGIKQIHISPAKLGPHTIPSQEPLDEGSFNTGFK